MSDIIARGMAKKIKDEQDALKTAVKKGKRIGFKIGFGGDSITFGSASSNASTHSFRVRLSRLLGYRVSQSSFNGGVAGERSFQLLARMDNIIAQNVDFISIMIGTNDAGNGVTLADYQQNIKAINRFFQFFILKPFCNFSSFCFCRFHIFIQLFYTSFK